MKRFVLIAALTLMATLAAAQTPDTPTSTTPPTTATSPTGDDTTTETAAAATTTTTTGFIDLGLQLVDVEPRSSKFLEYRDVPEGLAGPAFQVRTLTPSTIFRLSGSNLGEEDRNVAAYLDAPLFRIDAIYDQIPHRFGFDAKSIETRVGRDTYGIEDTTQRQFQTALEQQFQANRNGINFAFLSRLVEPALNTANTFDLELRRDRGFFDLQILPQQALDSHITYFQENRTGTRGAGTSFGFSNVVETAEPIEYRTRELGLNAEYPIRNGMVRGGLRVNEFVNALPSYRFDNPFRLIDSTDSSAYQAPGSQSINGPAFGRISLPPDNRALNGFVGLLYKLPRNSRLTADAGLGTWTQDQAFLPYSTNTAIAQAFAGPGGTPTPLPVASLDGEINTTTLNLQFTTTPFRNTNFVARYRSYDLDNNTDRITIPGYARFDASWQPTARISVPYGWSTSRAEIVGSYDFRLATVEAGFRQESVDRTFRETTETTDNIWRIAGDVRPFSWLIARASYESGRRTFDEYDFERGEDASFVVHPSAPLNLPQLRRFDQANRDSDRTILMLQMTPLETLTISFTASRSAENYDDDSDYGLLKWRTSAISGEADYSPSDRWSLFLFVTRDEVRGMQRGRQSGGTISTNPLDDWTADNTDEADTAGFGFNFVAVPDRIDVRVSLRYQTVDGFADLFSPPGGTPDIAIPIPEVDDTEFFTTTAEVDYRLAESWTVGLGGWLERYEIRDAQTTGTRPYMPGGFFLAENNGDYDGNVVYVRATYRF